MKNLALYERIMAFDIDGATVSFPFVAKLARENGWTLPFAERVIFEYKRFVFLAMTAPHACCPSESVDEAWHLHLTYTRSYWARFVPEVLGAPLHHDPSQGGVAEDEKHEDLYSRTLATYRDIFGQVAPEDIWLPVEQRFPQIATRSAKPKQTRTVWVRPIGLALVVLTLVLIGCSEREGSGVPPAVAGWFFLLVFFWILAVVASVGKKMDRKYRGSNSHGDSISDGDTGGGFWNSIFGDGSGSSNDSSSHGGHHSGGGHDGGGHGCGGHGCGGHGCGGHGCGGGGH